MASDTTFANHFSFSYLQCVALETDLHEAVSMSLADSLRILLEHGLLEGGEPVSYSGGWALFRVGHGFDWCMGRFYI